VFYTKSILSIFFLLTAFVSALSMLTLMGKTVTERNTSPVFLLRVHKWSGLFFIVLFLVISVFCLRYVAFIGDQLLVRAVFHGVLALVLFVVLLLKLSIVKFYRQFLKLVPQMGMTVFSLAFVTFCLSAGFFFLTRWHSSEVQAQLPSVTTSGNTQIGERIFDNKCSFCHYADKAETKIGPGLKDVLRKEKLPVSGKPSTPENVIQQLKNPFKNMPSFQSSLSEQNIKDLIAYLKTL